MTAAPELDARWEQVCETVATGDFDTYRGLYHDDCVVVDTTTTTEPNNASTKPIAQALEEWKPGFDETRSGRQVVQLAVRVARRLVDKDSQTTAHETGIFRYFSSSNTGAPPPPPPSVVYVQFEALSVKKQSHWLFTMEYQKRIATKEEWDALQPTSK